MAQMQRYAEYAPTGFDRRGAFSGAIGTEDQADGEEWLVAVGRNRDSCLLDRHNWDVFCRAIPEGEDAQIHRFGHWACGWFELLLVRPGTDAAATAQRLRDRLDEYPILEEDLFSELEWEETERAWRDAPMRWRMEECVRAGLSFLAARHECIPDCDDLREAFRPE